MHAEVFIPITMFMAIFGVLYVFLITRNKERMAMIEKDVDPNKFLTKPRRIGLKIGMLAMGIALGILIGQVLAATTVLEEEVATMSMVFFFGGMGLVANHFVMKREEQKDVM